MRKTWLRLAALLMSVMVAASGVGVAAAQDSGTDADAEAAVRVLAVDGPHVAAVGEAVKIRITERQSGAAVAGASVYALSWPGCRLADVISSEDAAAPLASYGCLYLGDSDGSGELRYSFANRGWYLIVATEEGYGPGLARLLVETEVADRLKIEGPAGALVGEEVALRVVERSSLEGIPDADVWAIKHPVRVAAFAEAASAARIKALIEELTQGDSSSLADCGGQYLGQTGGDGELRCTFDEPGRYLLIATKSGYVPGVKPLAVVADKALAIGGASRADVDEEVRFKVTTRGLGDPVQGAALYAVFGPVGNLKSMLEDLTEGDTSGLSDKGGNYLGETGQDGELRVEFDSPGMYLLLGVKNGYVPGAKTIWIGEVEGLDGLRQLVPRLDQLRERIEPWLREGFGGGLSWVLPLTPQ